jgi:prepilin-type N-terminal cleavage/methylation domain-containing protein
MQLSNKKGFTVVELMISITVFTVAILLVTSAVIYIGKQYQKGVNQAQLQDTARTIHQNITDAIKLNGAGSNNFTPIKGSGGFSYICLGNATYYFPTVASTDVVISSVEYNTMPTNLFVEYKPNSCIFNKSASVALLPDNAKVTKFSITDTGNGVWEVSTNFIIADEDLANIPTSGGIVKCKTNVAGREFCAQTNITSYASKRVN